MKADRIIDAVTDIDPEMLKDTADKRFKSGAAGKVIYKSTPLFIKIAAVAAFILVSAVTTICVATSNYMQDKETPKYEIKEHYQLLEGLIDKETSEAAESDTDSNTLNNTEHVAPYIKPTLKEIYEMEPYKTLLPKIIPDDFEFTGSMFLLPDPYFSSEPVDEGSVWPANASVYFRQRNTDNENVCFLTLIFQPIQGYHLLYRSGSGKYLPDIDITYVIKAEDLINEGPELLKKTHSYMVLCGDCVISFISNSLTYEELYDIITSSLYFENINK